jgi:2-dehydropantoate 2-reductase
VILVKSETARDRLARDGVCIEGEQPRSVIATFDASTLRDVDVMLVAVKAYDTVAALDPLRGLIGEATPIVSLQNGLEAVAQIEQALGPRPAVGLAPTSEGAMLVASGVVRRAGTGTTVLGWAQARTGGPELETLADSLTRCGLTSTVARPIEPHIWAKAIVNAAVNPLTALAGLRNGELLQRPELAARMCAIAREAAAVAAASGVTLPFEDAAEHVSSVVRATATNRSSMLQDFERGGPTEIEAIDGAIVRAARRLGVAVPETERALDEVRARARA